MAKKKKKKELAREEQFILTKQQLLLPITAFSKDIVNAMLFSGSEKERCNVKKLTLQEKLKRADKHAVGALEKLIITNINEEYTQAIKEMPNLLILRAKTNNDYYSDSTNPHLTDNEIKNLKLAKLTLEAASPDLTVDSVLKKNTSLTQEILLSLLKHEVITENFNKDIIEVESFLRLTRDVERVSWKARNKKIQIKDDIAWRIHNVSEVAVCIYNKTILSFHNLKFSSAEVAELFCKMLSDNLPFFLYPLIIAMNKHRNTPQTELYKYAAFRTPKGKLREVYNPHEDIKYAQRIALKTFDVIYRHTKKYKNIEQQFAYIQGKSCPKALERAMNDSYWMKADIKKFFDSVKFEDIVRFSPIIKTIRPEYQELISASIINEVTGGVFLGSPLSGVFTNFVTRNFVLKLERSLNKVAVEKRKEGEDLQTYKVTIYADDMIISSNKNFTKEYGSSFTNSILNEYFGERLQLHPDKTFKMVNEHRRALGGGVNGKNELIKPREYVKAIHFRPVLEHLAHGKKKYNEVMTRPFIAKLNECLKFERLNPIKGPLNRYIEKYDLKFQKKLRKSGVCLFEPTVKRKKIMKKEVVSNVGDEQN